MPQQDSLLAQAGVWARSQRRLGREDGVGGKPATYADRHYQRGYREGVERRAGLRVDRQTMWGGNGFGSETTHTAYVGELVVGEWRRTGVANWAYAQRGVHLMMYSAWRKALTEGATHA